MCHDHGRFDSAGGERVLTACSALDVLIARSHLTQYISSDKIANLGSVFLDRYYGLCFYVRMHRA